MKKIHIPMIILMLFTPFLFAILAGCQIHGKIPTSESIPTKENSRKQTPIPLTLTASTIRKEAPTKTIIPTNNSTQVFLPPPGEYIAYSYGTSIKLVSVAGKESGTLMEGANEGRNWLSPNQEIVAYSEELHILQFRNIYSAKIITIQEQETCRYGVTYLSWNPEGDKVVVSCFYGNNDSDLKILTYPEGIIVGHFEKIIDFSKDSINLPYKPTWSPDGKWIAFFVRSSSQIIGEKGPFITDTSCLSDDTTCAQKTILRIDNTASLLSWTPDSNLAIVDPYKSSINIYKMPSFYSLQTINISQQYLRDFHSFAWSHNDEWFAFGGMDGIFIMSSKTGEIKQVSSEAEDVLFWIEIK
jgi:WD40 repeat protein